MRFVTTSRFHSDVLLFTALLLFYINPVICPAVIQICDGSGALPCLNNNDKVIEYSPFYTDPNTEYKLKSYQDTKLHDWLADFFVDLARNVIIDYNVMDWEFVREIAVGNVTFNMATLPEITYELLVREDTIFGAIVFGMTVGATVFVCAVVVLVCQSCGKCGAHLDAREGVDQGLLPCILTCLTLTGCCMFMFIGAFALYAVSERVPKIKSFSMQSMEYSLDDLHTYTSAMFSQVRKIADVDLPFSIQAINYEAEGLVNVTEDAVSSEKSVITASIMADLSNITASIGAAPPTSEHTSLAYSIHSVNVTTDILVNTIVPSFSGKLVMTGMNIMLAQGHCTSTYSSPFCTTMPLFGDVPPMPNFAQVMPELDEAADFLALVQSQNFTGIGQQIEASLTALSQAVATAVQGFITDVDTTLSTHLTGVGSTINNTEDPLRQRAVDHLRSGYDRILPLAFEFEYWLGMILYGFMGLCLIVMAAMISAVLGCIYATLSYDHLARIRRRKGRRSYCMLLVSSVLCVIIGFGFITVGAILFFYGANFTLLCHGVIELDQYPNTVDHPAITHNKYILAEVILNDPDHQLTMQQGMQACRDNESAYTSLHLDSLFDLLSVANLTSPIPDWSPVDQSIVSVSQTFSAVDNSTKSDIQDLLNITAPGFDFHNQSSLIYEEVDKLYQSIQALKARIQASATNATVLGYNLTADELTGIHDNIVTDIEAGIFTALNETVANLTTGMHNLVDIISVIKNLSEDVLSSMDQLDTEARGTSLLVQPLRDHVEGIRNLANNTYHRTVDTLERDFLGCRPVYDIYMGLVNTLCYYVLDTFNGMWLSICVCGFFASLNFGLSIGYTRQIQALQDEDTLKKYKMKRRRLASPPDIELPVVRPPKPESPVLPEVEVEQPVKRGLLERCFRCNRVPRGERKQRNIYTDLVDFVFSRFD